MKDLERFDELAKKIRDMYGNILMTAFDPVSVTVPDQAYSIQELLERHRQGILTDTGISREGFYPDGEEEPNFDDPDLEKLSNSDLVDKQQYLGELQDRIDKGKKIDAKRKSEKDKVLSQAEKEREQKAGKEPA